MNTENRPGVGVGILVIKDGKILLGKRKGKYGNNTWSPPGGHLEFKENVFECAKRETLEETGIEIDNLKNGPFVNDNNLPYDKHYITLYVIASHEKNEPIVTEPDKCESWEWFDLNNLPTPLFYPFQNFIDAGFKSYLNKQVRTSSHLWSRSKSRKVWYTYFIMNYLYKSSGLLLVHILVLFVLFFVFPKSVPMIMLSLLISIIFSIFYVIFGYKSYKYEGVKLGGSLFIILGCLGVLASLLATAMSLSVLGLGQG